MSGKIQKSTSLMDDGVASDPSSVERPTKRTILTPPDLASAVSVSVTASFKSPRAHPMNSKLFQSLMMAPVHVEGGETVKTDPVSMARPVSASSALTPSSRSIPPSSNAGNEDTDASTHVIQGFMLDKFEASTVTTTTHHTTTTSASIHSRRSIQALVTPRSKIQPFQPQTPQSMLSHFQSPPTPEPMDVDVLPPRPKSPIARQPQQPAIANQPTRPHPLFLPEILMHIFSFLQAPVKTASDPTQPLDFVKVDSIKYTVSKPRLHSCALVCKLWNACAMQYLWRNVNVNGELGFKRLLRTLGLPQAGEPYDQGQLRAADHPAFLFVQGESSPSACWTPRGAATCEEHRGLRILPSPVNAHIYGKYIQHFALIQPHGPGSESFQQLELNDLVMSLALNCPNLQELNLSNCPKVSDEAMTLVARHCAKLQKLNLNRCDLVSTETVRALAKYPNDFVILNLSRPLLQQRTSIDDGALFALLEKSSRLKELRLRNCDKVTDKTVIKMAQTCGKNLLALDLSWCGQITDKAIIQGLAPHCPKLQSLALNGCKKLTDAFLSSLLQHCPNIASLSVAHLPFITDTILTTMASSLKNLVILSLNGCTSVHDESIIALSENCPKLQSLSLFALDITDASVVAVSQRCTQLLSLSVSNCERITDAGAMAIALLKQLQSLYLNKASITSRSIKIIATHCKNIRALSLNECRQVGDEGIVFMARRLVYLQSLSLNQTAVTAVGVRVLLESCHDLRELSIKECERCQLEGPEASVPLEAAGVKARGDLVLNEILRRRIALIK